MSSEMLISFGPLILALILGIVAAVYWRRQQQSILRGYGLTLHWWSLGDLGFGFLITFVAMVGIFLVELLVGGIHIVGTQFSLASISSTVMGELVFAAVFEEVFFRAFLLNGLAILLGGRKWLAILISAALFGIVHFYNPGASYVSAFGNALGGIIYGMAFLGGRNIWLPLGLHFSWNFTQGPILGFPVSGVAVGGFFQQEITGSTLLTGGSYGPEAGLVGMVFRFVIMAMVLYYLQRRSHGRGDVASLNFPLKEYENAPRPR